MHRNLLALLAAVVALSTCTTAIADDLQRGNAVFVGPDIAVDAPQAELPIQRQESRLVDIPGGFEQRKVVGIHLQPDLPQHRLRQASVGIEPEYVIRAQLLANFQLARAPRLVGTLVFQREG